MLENIFVNILSMSTIASIVFFFILIVRNCIKNKVKYENISLLWIIFIIVLIVPLNFQSKLSIKNFINIDETYKVKETSEIYVENIDKETVEKLIKDEAEISFTDIISKIWITVASLLIIMDTCIYKSLNSRKNIEVPERIKNILKECKEELNIRKDIQIILQNKIKIPSLYGILHTQIILEEKIVNFSNNELKCIILHELNHYKQKHNFLYMIFNIIERVHWFNPFIKLAFKIIKQDLEIIIDSCVLKQNISIKEYCMTIIKITELYNLKESKMPSIIGGKKEIERRIKYMKNSSVKNSIFVTMTAIMIISILTVSFASDKLEKSKNNNQDVINEIFNEFDNQEETIQEVEYILPVKYTGISAMFGKRIHPITKEERIHTGIDLVAEEGTKVKAAASGVIEIAEFDISKGNYVEIRHIDGSISSYQHGSSILVEVGDIVEIGDEIMTVGKTGNATGPHLHFEVRNAQNEYMDVNTIVE